MTSEPPYTPHFLWAYMAKYLHLGVLKFTTASDCLQCGAPSPPSVVCCFINPMNTKNGCLTFEVSSTIVVLGMTLAKLAN